MVEVNNIAYKGDRFICQRYIGDAHRAMAMLRADMGKQKLEIGRRIVNVHHALIEAVCCHGVCTATISTEGFGEEIKKEVKNPVPRWSRFILIVEVPKGKGVVFHRFWLEFGGRLTGLDTPETPFIRIGDLAVYKSILLELAEIPDYEHDCALRHCTKYMFDEEDVELDPIIDFPLVITDRTIFSHMVNLGSLPTQSMFSFTNKHLGEDEYLWLVRIYSASWDGVDEEWDEAISVVAAYKLIYKEGVGTSLETVEGKSHYTNLQAFWPPEPIGTGLENVYPPYSAFPYVDLPVIRWHGVSGWDNTGIEFISWKHRFDHENAGFFPIKYKYSFSSNEVETLGWITEIKMRRVYEDYHSDLGLTN